MNKKLIAFALVALLAVGAASAQLAVGVSGALYSDTELTWDQQKAAFNDGEGIFYGPFVELGLGKLAIGLSVNMSSYVEDWGMYGYPSLVSLIDYDFSLYFQAHLFHYASFIDPFLEAGFGQMGTTIEDADAPLRATNYFQMGGGIGLNLGPLGIFWKGLYMFPSGDPVVVEYDGGYGPVEYSLAEFPLKNMKFILAAKLNL